MDAAIMNNHEDELSALLDMVVMTAITMNRRKRRKTRSGEDDTVDSVSASLSR